MYVDAGKPSSYNGTTTWTDLSGNSNHMTLAGSPTYSSLNGGTLTFTSSQTATSSLNYSTSNFTMMAATRYVSGGSNSRIISSANVNWLFGHWSGNCQSYFANGWVYGPTGGVDQNWRIYACTENYSANQRSFYINNTAMVTNSASGSSGPNGFGINIREAGTGQVSFILLYNRILTTAEMTQNYNAFKSRFSLA